jgi:O-antigen/teichoic acid export membrane protein
VVAILLGANWEPAVALLRVLCFVPLLDIADFGGEVLKVRHEDRTWLLIMLLNLASLIGFGILFTSRWGAYGMAWANLLPLGNLILLARLAAILGDRFGQLLRDLAIIYLSPLPLFLLAAWTGPPGSWSRFAVSGVATLLAGAILVARFYRPFRTFLRPAAVPE